MVRDTIKSKITVFVLSDAELWVLLFALTLISLVLGIERNLSC